MPSIVRSISFAALTDVPSLFQSGSTVASGKQALLRASEDPEAIPVRELWHVAQQRPLRDRHVVFVAGNRQEPWRRALEHDEIRRDVGDARNELRGAGTGADHGDPLAAQVDGVVPPGRVEPLPLEVVDAFDVGHRGPVELSGRATRAHRVDASPVHGPPTTCRRTTHTPSRPTGRRAPRSSSGCNRRCRSARCIARKYSSSTGWGEWYCGQSGVCAVA